MKDMPVVVVREEWHKLRVNFTWEALFSDLREPNQKTWQAHVFIQTALRARISNTTFASFWAFCGTRHAVSCMISDSQGDRRCDLGGAEFVRTAESRNVLVRRRASQ